MEYRFFIRTAAVEKAACDALARDRAAARLSRTARTYYRLRPYIPVGLRRKLQRTRRVETDEDWYIPHAAMRALACAIENQPQPPAIIHPWPCGAQHAFVLTHDVEEKDGLRRIPAMAQIEEDLGFRSSWNIVPHKYRVDAGLLRDLESRSFEIGVHGYNHDGRLYWSRRTFERRTVAINEALRRYRAVGFRSPMNHRNLEWLQQLDIQYDASFFDIDPYQPMPGGVGTLWPFVAGKFVELPYTLPQDHTLFVVLGKQECGVWKRKLDFVAKNHGMALMLTHPDYMASDRYLDLYRQFLLHVREVGNYWHALPREVAAWWRAREESRLEDDAQGNWRVLGPAAQSGIATAVEVHNGHLQLNPPSLALAAPYGSLTGEARG